MSVPRIVSGLELIDDEGDEVVVYKINVSRGTVMLRTSDDDTYSMLLRELRSKLRDGEFAVVEGDDEDEPDSESDGGEETEDDDDEDEPV
jgi:hypothetical protein